MKNLLVIIALLAVSIMLTHVLVYGIKKHEINECVKWQAEAEIYPLYYLVGWQADQCAAHNIKVGAPVIETKLQWKEKQVRVARRLVGVCRHRQDIDFRFLP